MDRYKHSWIYNNDLKFLWSGEGQTGHFPYPYDVDGDGREEFMIGYALWAPAANSCGAGTKTSWIMRKGLSWVTSSGDPSADPIVYTCGSDEGFLLFDKNGKTLKHVRIGHAQSPSIGRYRMDVPGLQLLTVSFWRNPGILSLFDFKGICSDRPSRFTPPAHCCR